MISVCVFSVASMAASFVGRSLVFALATSPQLTAADPSVPTPKEQALMEHACPAPLTPAAYEAHERCLGARLQSLREDFGRDLSRLSPAARRKLDATCSPLQASRGREGYIDCLSVQLALLSAGRVRAALPAPDGATLPASALAPSSAAPSTPALQASSLLTVRSGAAVLTAAAGLTALVFFGVKAKRARHVCRVCGVRVPSGDLCLPCRHEAAEAVRRAAGERTEREREHEAEQRRQGEHADEQRQRQEQLRREEEERLRRLDEARLEEEARRCEEDARRQAEDLQLTRSAAESDDADAIFDPYHALGLAADASVDAVRAAYEVARLKYDPDQVAHLGDDAQAHYAAKSRAVERAYKLLTDSVQ